MVNAPALTPFAGKYRLLRVLGRGAMGEVWLAEEEGPMGFRRRVAVKRLLATQEAGDYATESFIAEAQVVARIDHPNVVRLIELGSSDGGLYLVLDYVDGVALDVLLKRTGALSPETVAYIGREVSRALEAVHSMCDESGRNYGVVHRDVSPSNILIGRDGRVRLSDFGVARISGIGGDKTQTGVFKGKLAYMPPEQARGEGFDGRADLFSLGITLFEALLGARLRRAETQTQLLLMIVTERVPRVLERIPGAPPILARTIDHATENDPNLRVPHAGEMAALLEDALRSFGSRSEVVARDELKAKVASLVPASPSAASGSYPTPVSNSAGFRLPSGPGLDHTPGSQPSAQSAVRLTASGGPAYGGHEQPTVIESSARLEGAPAPLSRRWAAAAVAIGALVAGGAFAVFFALNHPDRTTSNTAASAVVAGTTTAAPSVALETTSTAPLPASVAASAVIDADHVASAAPSVTASAAPRPTNAPRPVPTPAATADEPANSSEPGTLQVTAAPWADVSVDGRPVGTTPMAPISLTPGPHSVVLRNSDLGATRSYTVTVKPGKPAFLNINLKQAE